MKISAPRDFLKLVFYGQSRRREFGWLAVFFLQWVRSIESQRLVHKTSKHYGFSKLDLREVQRLYPTPEVAFILGKGPSRALLDDFQLSEVQRGLSVGLNDTDFSDVVPTYEMRELSTLDGVTQPLPDRKANKSRLSCKILSHVSVGGPSLTSATTRKIALIEAGPEPAENFLVYSSSNLMTSVATTCATTFFAASNARRLGLWPKSILTGSSASLLRAISLLLSLNAKRIVLIGVDLAFDLSPGSVLHPTMNPKGVFAPNLKDVLIALNTRSRSRGDHDVILLGHPVGVLSPEIPSYEWPRN